MIVCANVPDVWKLSSPWLTPLETPYTKSRCRDRDVTSPPFCFTRSKEINAEKHRARIISFSWITVNAANLHRAPTFRFAWYVNTALAARATDVCVVLLLRFRSLLATEQLVLVTSLAVILCDSRTRRDQCVTGEFVRTDLPGEEWNILKRSSSDF